MSDPGGILHAIVATPRKRTRDAAAAPARREKPAAPASKEPRAKPRPKPPAQRQPPARPKPGEATAKTVPAEPGKRAEPAAVEAGVRTLAVIPARYGAHRLPGKPLLRDTGKYLVQHVYERAKAARRLERVVVATDDERIARACERFGAEAVMTPVECPSGTDRVARAAAALRWDGEVVMNVQGDEPEIAPDNLDILVGLMERTTAPMGTLVYQSSSEAEFRRRDVVKCVCRADGRALYFTRAGVPYARDSTFGSGAGFYGLFLKHLGVYAYRRAFLVDTLAKLEPSTLEGIECLEQLRVLENGYEIAVAKAVSDSNGIDTQDQYREFIAREAERARGRG